MNASPEVLALVQDLVAHRYSRSELSRWLAERSLIFLESRNELDRMVVADLDAALGEVQSGRQQEDFLSWTAKSLVSGLGLSINTWEIPLSWDNSEPLLTITTGSLNQGGMPMAVAAVEVVPSTA